MENNTERKKLMIEYVNAWKTWVYWPLKMSGFSRFDILNGEIVRLTTGSLIYNVIILIIADCGAAFLLYSSIYEGNYLKIPDGLCVFHFAMFANLMSLNISFINNHTGLEILENYILVDIFLGARQTSFLRKIGLRYFVAVNFMIFITNVGVGIYLYKAYKVSIFIHIIGSTYFYWLFFFYIDFNFGLMLITFITLRAKYLNVAVMKIGDMKDQYLPKLTVFDSLLWNRKFDKLVKFQKEATNQDFVKAYGMIFDLVKLYERCFNFSSLSAIWTIVMGSYVAVQTFIMNMKNSGDWDSEHTYVIVGWVILSWGFLLLLATTTDMLQQQMHQTRLVCSFVQLKNNNRPIIYKLTKSILRTLETRSARPSIYNMLYCETGLIVRMAASTFVYITVQLQLAFPMSPLTKVKLNETWIEYRT